MQISTLELITRTERERESVNYEVMTSMGAYILQDNGPDAVASAILREALSARQRKQRQTVKETRLSVIYRRRFSEELIHHSDGTVKERVHFLSASLSSLYRLLWKEKLSE